MNCEFGRVERNHDRAVELLTSVEAELYVLPELFNTGYLFESRQQAFQMAEAIPGGRTCQRLLQVSKNRNCIIIGGLAERAGDAVYNSAVLVEPNGRVAVYRKIHLFSEEKLWFDPGDKPFQVVDVSGVKIGMMICFDWIFPESMRTLALLGADIVCHPANLVLPYCQNAMVTRCLENRVFAITANRIGFDQRKNDRLSFTGKSQITGHLGEILVRASEDEEEVGVFEIDPALARDKNITDYNHLLSDRRPELYKR
jgi:predicted amidohydrolase